MESKFFAMIFVVVVGLVAGRPAPQGDVEPGPTTVLSVITIAQAPSLNADTAAEQANGQQQVVEEGAPVIADALNQPSALSTLVDSTELPSTTSTTTTPPTTAVKKLVTILTGTVLYAAGPLPTLPTVPPASRLLGDWQRGATYSQGDEVTFGGVVYRALQQVTPSDSAIAQSPVDLPALWTRATSL